MQYHIYHATGDKRFTEAEEQPRVYAGYVDAPSLEHAFTKSQNFEGIWNPTNPCRSTSVGDVIQDDDGFHMVCGLGFRKLVSQEPNFTKTELKQVYIHSARLKEAPQVRMNTSSLTPWISLESCRKWCNNNCFDVIIREHTKDSPSLRDKVLYDQAKEVINS